MKPKHHLLISLFLTAIIGYFLYRSVPDWQQAWAVMVSGRPTWLLAGLGFVGVHMLLRAIRWGVLLSHLKAGISLRNLISLTLVRYVVNVIPPRVGEVAASVLLARKERIPTASVIATSVFERVLDTLAVLVLFAVYLFFFAGRYVPSSDRGQEIFETIRHTSMVGLAAMALGFGALTLALRSRRWHALMPQMVRRHVLSFMDGLRSMQSRPAVVKTLLLSLLIWLVISAQLWSMIRAYLEIFPAAGSLLIMAVTVVGVAIPTPAGVGGFQFFMNLSLIHFFRQFLTSPDAESQAGGISNGTYLVSMVPVILVGLVMLHREGMSFRSITQGEIAADQK